MDREDETPETVDLPRDKRVTIPATPAARTRGPRETVSPPPGEKKKVPAPVWMTLIAGVITAFFEYRTQAVKVKTEKVEDKAEVVEAKTEVSYDTLAPLVRDLQEQQKVLAAQVDLLREIALANNREIPLTAKSSPAQVARQARTEATVDRLEQLPPALDATAAKPPPSTLDEAAASAP